MKTPRATLARLLGLFRRKRHEAEMNEELQAHLDGLSDRNIAAGMSPDEARQAARRAFGGVEQIKEQARDERRSVWGEHLAEDIRYAFRQLKRAPGFTAVVVLSLALGIGANTAIFTVINALLLRALPVRHPEQLVILDGDGTYARFDQLRTAVTSLSGLFAAGGMAQRQVVMSDHESAETESAIAQEVSGDFFSVLGEPALLGRSLLRDDDQAGAARPVVVLSHRYWQRRFAGNPAILGTTLTLSNVAVSIVGVMPPGYFGIDAGQARGVDLWCPLWLKPQLDDGFEGERLTTYASGSHWLTVMGRLRDGTSLDQARAEVDTICRNLGPLRPGDPAPRIKLSPGESGVSRMRGSLRQPLNVLWTIAGLVLLVACANVGGLLLARGAARQREFAVRLALGAGRARIIQQLVTESLLLALLGGALGLLVASWGMACLGRYIPGSALDLRMDQPVLFFTATVSAITGILFGLAPSLHFSRLDLVSAFGHGNSVLTRPAQQRLNRALVIAQIALSFTLLAGAGLFVRTLQNMRLHDPGFARENRLQFTIDLGRAQAEARRVDVHRRVLAEIESLPGVQSAAIATGGLLGTANRWRSFSVDGVEMTEGKNRGVLALSGSRRYFETKGVPLLRGRDFEAGDDRPGAPPVAVISETIAKKYFPNENPIGRFIQQAPNDRYEVIGVARDAQVRGWREPPHAAIYLPYFHDQDVWMNRAQLCVRGNADPLLLMPSLRAAVKKIDYRAELTGLGSIQELLEQRLTRERAVAELSVLFSGLTLALAGIGLYGLLAYGVVQRTREIGVRLALGAQTRDVLRLVIRRGIKLVIIGSALGAVGTLGFRRFVGGLLYGVDAADHGVLFQAALLLFAVALAACWLPARRAARVDPMIALRAE